MGDLEGSGTLEAVSTASIINSSATSPHDSMVTVRLSEPPLSKFDSLAPARNSGSGPDDQIDQDERLSYVPVAQLADLTARNTECCYESDMDESDRDTVYDSRIASTTATTITTTQSLSSELRDEGLSRRGSASSGSSSSVNWESLERTEEQEPRNQDTEDVSGPLFLCMTRS